MPQALEVPLLQHLGCPGVQVLPGLPVGDQEFIGPHVLPAVQQDAAGGQAVPPGAARLLVVALDVLGHVVVDDIADVRLVDAHAKGVGGHHDRRPVIEEILLIFPPLLRLQACVVSGGGDAPLVQEVTDLLYVLPGGTVDDPAFSWAALHQLQQCRLFVLRLLNLKIQVLPVEASGKAQRLPQPQQLFDVLFHIRGGRGGKGPHHRPPGQGLHERRDIQIGGPEVLAPLGDAVGLVHSDQGDVRVLRKGAKALGLQPLRRHIDDLVPSGLGPVQSQ